MFDRFEKDCVLFFSQDGCGACNQVKSILDECDSLLPVYNIVDEYEIAKHFNIAAVPVLLILKDHEEYDRVYGPNGAKKLNKIISEM